MKTIKPLRLTSAITALANAISGGMTDEEIALVAGILVQLGDTLATIAASRAICPDQSKTDLERKSQADNQASKNHSCGDLAAAKKVQSSRG